MYINSNQLTKALFLVVFLIAISLRIDAQETDYHGFKGLDFKLKNKKHTLILRMSAAKNPEGVGNSCRIHQFAVNN